MHFSNKIDMISEKLIYSFKQHKNQKIAFSSKWIILSKNWINILYLFWNMGVGGRITKNIFYFSLNVHMKFVYLASSFSNHHIFYFFDSCKLFEMEFKCTSLFFQSVKRINMFVSIFKYFLRNWSKGVKSGSLAGQLTWPWVLIQQLGIGILQ